MRRLVRAILLPLLCAFVAPAFAAGPQVGQTAPAFRETMMLNLLLWGNCYAAIERDELGQPVALLPLRADRTPVDLLRACFPGGSVTGAPKVRAMEIIEEAEKVRRGPYCGAIGYIGFDGAMDTSITIRTLVYEGNRVWFNAGGGIVADSDPSAEYQETLYKAAAIFESFDHREPGVLKRTRNS